MTAAAAGAPPVLAMLLDPRTLTARRADRGLSTAAVVVAGSVLLAALSLLLPTVPTYDPWSWIVWGREITQLDLNTVNGPSWKPLPVVVTTIGAVFGDGAPWVWMLVARAGAIAGVALTFLLARRLAGPAAGIAAAVAVALAPWYLRNAALGNSEGLMVALLLAAVLAHLGGRRGWAFAFAIGCGLLRPEAWPFLGLYALWLLWEDRSRLLWLGASLAGMLAAWLGPELWGSGDPWRASDRAQQPNADSPAFADRPGLQVVENAVDMVPAPALAGALVALVLALVLRRRRSERRTVALGLLALAAAWIGLVAAMTVGGFSGNQRYLVVPAALLAVVGAAGIVWMIVLVAPRLRRVPATAAAAGGLVLAATFAAPMADSLPAMVRGVEYQVSLTRDLEPLVAEAGGAERLLACGRAYTGPFLVPAVAWELGVHIEDVRLEPEPPAVVFHVKTTNHSRWFSPGLRAGAPRTLARRGGWIVSADCRVAP